MTHSTRDAAVDITIDRLTLRLEGLAAGDSERLAQIVAGGLAAAGGALEAPCHVAAIRIHGTVVPGGSLEPLADRIVAAIIRQLASAV